MISAVRTVAPTGLVVPLAEAKAHLRVDAADEDALVSALVAAATEHLEGPAGILGRALLTQTWRQDYDAFPPDARTSLVLPLAPVQSVASVVYRDCDGVEQTLAASAYHVVTRDQSTLVELASGGTWPSTAERPDAVRVTFVAGYGSAADVPAPIKAAVLLIVGDLYQNREVSIVGAIRTENPSARALLAPFRRIGV